MRQTLGRDFVEGLDDGHQRRGQSFWHAEAVAEHDSLDDW